MKIHSLHPLAALGLFAAGLASGPLASGPQEDTPSQLETLRTQIRTVGDTVKTLKADQEAMQAQVDGMTQFLTDHGARADALLGSLDASEVLGFTKGINFSSREELLAGFRTFLNSTKDGLNSLKASAEPEPAKEPRQRR